jgi:hypothetical protein
MAQIAIVPARKKIHHGSVTTSAAVSATSVSERRPSRKNTAPSIPSINAMATPSILSSIRSATQIEPRIKPEQPRRRPDRLLVRQCLDEGRQRDDRSEDAGERREQPHPFDALERGEGTAAVDCEQLTERVGRPG